MSTVLSRLNIKNYEINENKITVRTDSDCIIHIKAVSKKTLEVWTDFDGKGIESHSYSIEDMPEYGAEFQCDDKNEHLFVSAGIAALRIRKKGIKISLVSSDDKTVICDGKEIGKNNDGSVFMENLIAENEHFYGLGEDNDGYLGSLDRRGQTRDMITEQRINAGHVTADIPVTFYMSTGDGQPYGIFTDNSYPMTYDIGKTDPDIIYQSALSGDMKFYCFVGDSFGDILNEYTNLTGKPPMPPLWTLGYTQCRCSYWSWEQIDELVSRLREHRFPLDCLVFDYDWADKLNNYKWNQRWGGRSPEKLAEYRAQGLHFMASNSGPMLKKDSDTYRSALDEGILARDAEGNTITCGHFGGDLIDFTNPNTKEWLRPQLERILDDGIEAWWLDLTEPEGDPENTVYFGGERNKIHNVFSLLNTKTYTEITREHLPEMRPFVLTRTGTAGIQKYCTAIWSGDVYSDYETFTAHIPEALNTGMSGIPMWTSDAGGFISETSNAKDTRHLYKNDIARHANLYERWVQFAAFCPIMRVHHAGESAPYMFNSLVTDSVSHYVRLRYRLLPYIYSYTYKTHITGESIMRPLVFEYPNDGNVYDIKDEFLFGSELLIAPVHEEEKCSRRVYLPEGKWYDYDYGYEYEGGKSYDIYAPQNRIPVFVKSGAIIPMTEQIYNTSELDNRIISLDIYPCGKSGFMLYADDGRTYAYEKGEFTLTEILCDAEESTVVITTAASNELFAAKRLNLKIHVDAIPNSVIVNGTDCEKMWHRSMLKAAENGWFYDDFNRVLYISAGIDGLYGEVIVEYDEEKVYKPHRDRTAETGEQDIPSFIFKNSLY